MPHQGMIASFRVLIDMHLDHIRRELRNRLRTEAERKQAYGLKLNGSNSFAGNGARSKN